MSDLVGNPEDRFSEVAAQIPELDCYCHMSRDVRKPVFGVSDQVRHKPGWEINEDG